MCTVKDYFLGVPSFRVSFGAMKKNYSILSKGSIHSLEAGLVPKKASGWKWLPSFWWFPPRGTKFSTTAKASWLRCEVLACFVWNTHTFLFFPPDTVREMKFCLVVVRGKDKPLHRELLLTLLHLGSERKWRIAADWILKLRKLDGRKKN